MHKEVLINKKAGEEEWAMAFTENKSGDWWERVVKYKLVFDAQGKPTFNVERGEEFDGMMSMRDLAMLGQKWVVWISPKGGMSNYPESRIVVGKVEKVLGGVEMDCLGICSPQSGEECLSMGNKLRAVGGIALGEITDVESLRKNAIGLETGDKETLFLIRRIVEVNGVWAAVEDGRVDANNKIMLERMKYATASMPDVRTMSDRAIQFHLETVMRNVFNISLMTGGNHGGSVINNGVSFGTMTPFNYLFDRTKIVAKETVGAKYCKHCGVYYIGDKCPVCG